MEVYSHHEVESIVFLVTQHAHSHTVPSNVHIQKANPTQFWIWNVFFAVNLLSRCYRHAVVVRQESLLAKSKKRQHARSSLCHRRCSHYCFIFVIWYLFYSPRIYCMSGCVCVRVCLFDVLIFCGTLFFVALSSIIKRIHLFIKPFYTHTTKMQVYVS